MSSIPASGPDHGAAQAALDRANQQLAEVKARSSQVEAMIERFRQLVAGLR